VMLVSMSEKTYIIRPGFVEYLDLCEHRDQSREDFFTEAEPKTLRKYGLIMKCDKYVKVMHEDDLSHNEECEGLVIPLGCILDIQFLEPVEEEDVPLLDKDSNIN
jgi:hypothetical protein